MPKRLRFETPWPLSSGRHGAAALILGLGSFAAHAADRWLLAAREGGCHPIATLERKLPDLPAVRDPRAFEDYVRAKGWAFTQKRHALGTGQAVEFTVPDQGLALMFVTSELCATPGR